MAGVDVIVIIVVIEGAGVSGCSGKLFSDMADRWKPDVGRKCPEDNRREPQHPTSASHLIFILLLFPL